MYEYVVRKEFVGYLIFDVRKNEITLQDDYSQLKNIKFIDNYYDGYLSAPTQVFAEITDDCQLKCKHCFNGNRRGNAYLETSVWEKIIDRLDECGVFRIRISGGEPFLRKDIIEILKYIDTKSIRYSVYTNGLNVDQCIEELKGLKKLDCIRVSIDGTKEVNDYLRGDGTYDETIQTILHLEECGIPCEINFTIMEINYRSLGELSEQLKKLGIKSHIHVGFAKIGGRALENINLCFTDESKFEQQACEIRDCINSHENIAEYVLLRPLYNKIYGKAIGCPGGRISAVIRANGAVSPCGFLADDEFYCGSIVDTSMIDIWHHKNMDRVRKLKIRQECKECKFFFKNCTGGCLANPYNYFGDLNGRDINCATYRAFCKVEI